ncbi:MAG TPA: ribosomal protein S18-alanine N-acetyltransferase [Acetobacteraceae bacterium]|jgi:[ribosomal protein S18]-alanine N-acetyltransferase|nr:ribosomal protein S18-alanine N-acetyltransferase [Acetobacteraceae bacterium]
MKDLIQRATPAHIVAMAEIHAASFPPREAWEEDAFALQLVMPGVFGLIHPHGGLLLARVTMNEAEVLTLAVAPEARRQGIARALLAAAMATAKRQDACEMFLEVAVGNASAQALYKRAGFTEAGRRPRYYADGGDALVLRAPLQ